MAVNAGIALTVADGLSPDRPRISAISARRAQRELVPVDPHSLLTLRDTRHTHFSYPWHYHPEAELTLIVDGSGLRYVGDSIHEFEPGDFCLIGADTPHCWLSKPIPGHPVRALVVQFPRDVFGTGFLELAAAKPIAELLHRAGRGLRLTGALHAKVKAEMSELFNASPRPIDRLSRLLSILTLMAESEECVALALTAAKRPESPRHEQAAREILQYIHDNAATLVSQREVARRAGLSPAGFSRFFSRHFGKPFVTYVAEVRVGNACRMLLEGDRSIAEVAVEVGFNNLANFNRRFRFLKGMTPSDYRRMARGIASA